MSGFEVEIADMDLLRQLFDRQRDHLSAIGTYVQGNCQVPGGFGIVLQPLQPHYESAYDSGVKGFAGGVRVAEACSTKIDETKQSIVATDRAQYERYARQQAAMGHDVPPYQAPAGGGTLPPASHGYSPGAEDGDPYSVPAPAAWAAERGYDLARAGVSMSYDAQHAAPPAGDGSTDSGSTSNDPNATSNDPNSGTSNSGTSNSGTSDSGTSSSGTSNAGSSDGSTSSTSGTSNAGSSTSGTGSGSGSSDPNSSSSSTSNSGSSNSGSSNSGSSNSGSSGSGGPGRHADTGPNTAGKVVEIINAPGEFESTYDDVTSTFGTSGDLVGAANGPVNDDQTDWADEKGSGW